MKVLLSAIFATLLSGCLFPGDTAFKVHGEAPKNNDCFVSAIWANPDEIISTIEVSGEFTETFVFGVTRTSQVDVLVECEGKEVHRINNVITSNHLDTPVELGEISP